MAEDYKIKITTEGDAQGANKVADAIKGVGKAAGETGKEARGLGNDLESLGARNNATKDVVEGLDSAMRGNAASIFGVAKAAKNLWEVLSVSTPLGRFVQLAIIAANAIPLVGRSMAESGKQAAEAAPEVDKLAEAFEKAGKARTEAFSKTLAGIKDEAKSLGDELERILGLQARIGKAKNPDGDIDGDRQREDMKLGNEYNAAVGVRNRTAELVATINTELGELEKSLRADRDARVARRGLELELQGLQRMPGGTSPEAMARGDRMQAIQRELEATAGINSPQTIKFALEQKKRADQLKLDEANAAKEAAAAEEALRRVGRDVVGLKSDGSAIRDPSVANARGIEDRNRRKAAGLPEPGATDNGSGHKMDTPWSFSMGAPEKNYDAIARTLLQAGERSGAEMGQAMIEAVKASQAALVEAFREQLKALQR